MLFPFLFWKTWIPHFFPLMALPQMRSGCAFFFLNFLPFSSFRTRFFACQNISFSNGSHSCEEAYLILCAALVFLEDLSSDCVPLGRGSSPSSIYLQLLPTVYGSCWTATVLPTFTTAEGRVCRFVFPLPDGPPFLARESDLSEGLSYPLQAIPHVPAAHRPLLCVSSLFFRSRFFFFLLTNPKNPKVNYSRRANRETPPYPPEHPEFFSYFGVFRAPAFLLPQGERGLLSRTTARCPKPLRSVSGSFFLRRFFSESRFFPCC